MNLADFNVLAANFGLSGRTWETADFNRDGVVNLADFNVLAANFGLSAAGPELTPQDWRVLAAAVPEPGCALASSTMLGLLAYRRWTTRHPCVR